MEKGEKIKPTFSVFEEPSGAPLTGNLTGIPRKIKDCCADFYNSIQQWNNFCIEGAYILKNIKESKIQAINKTNKNAEVEYSSEFPPELQDYCLQLQNVVDQMEEVLLKITKLTEQLKAVSELSIQHCSRYKDFDYSIPVFQTWPVDKFYITTKKILNMYRKEFKVKCSILKEIAYLKEENAMAAFIVAWTYEPYIEEESKLFLECMALETGLKS